MFSTAFSTTSSAVPSSVSSTVSAAYFPTVSFLPYFPLTLHVLSTVPFTATDSSFAPLSFSFFSSTIPVIFTIISQLLLHFLASKNLRLYLPHFLLLSCSSPLLYFTLLTLLLLAVHCPVNSYISISLPTSSVSLFTPCCFFPLSISITCFYNPLSEKVTALFCTLFCLPVPSPPPLPLSLPALNDINWH